GCRARSTGPPSRVPGPRSVARGTAWRDCWMMPGKVDRPAWEGVIAWPVRDRAPKPREQGWSMVIDKGLGLHAIDDLMQMAAPLIDVVKLTFGTSAFYTHDLLKEKVRTIVA